MVKIHHWTSHLLSFAGKIQLVKSVKIFVTSYWIQIFPMPKKIIHQIESIGKMFLWSRKSEGNMKAPIACDKVCEPKNAGGLNITSVRYGSNSSMVEV